jgi:hypothetical protein
MMHINVGCLFQFYVHMTLTSPDTIWIMFKKGFVLYLPNREVIRIVTVIQLPASQFVVVSRPCSILNWNNNGYSVTNGFVKQK